jgi:diaminopimelate decarboxylase
MQLPHHPVVYVSGVNSGPNPSPGVGVARSLRQAYPEGTLVAVDYSARSSGLHWQDFNFRWVQADWNSISLSGYTAEILRTLESNDGLWISGLDLETRWLAQSLNKHPRILTPSFETLERIRKPAQEVAAALGIHLPSWIPLAAPQRDLHAFARRFGFQLWLKGPWYEAIWINSWSHISLAQRQLDNTWGCGKSSFLQQHITGREESIAFAAYRGRLLASIAMVKSEVTIEGKTWAGTISLVASDLAARLEHAVSALDYSGGGEVEMVRDKFGKLWILEVNPRFPAWIYGATLAGCNLPAALIAAATGIKPRPNRKKSNTFARVVLEIPTNEGA